MDSNYAFHLAMAALVGATFAAASAYYMHRKTLTELLDFARERERAAAALPPRHRRRKSRGGTRRPGSMSLPDIVGAADVDGEEEEDEDEEEEAAQGVNGGLAIPPGLPRLHVAREGAKPLAHSGSVKRMVQLVRPSSPKSPNASASAYGSLEGSDDDDAIQDDPKLDTIYLHSNGTIENGAKIDLKTENGESNALSSAMIRSHSVSGDLHGVQPDPIAADILRKEPEQESFTRLRITPIETPAIDEIDVYKTLQTCLELRDSYIYREEVAPWEKEVITDPSTPKPNPNPFSYTPEGKTEHSFQMVDGVVHVYSNEDRKERLYPVADATTFFTDLHYILRVIAAGNIRTVCHNRLNLLEHVNYFYI